MRRLAPVANWLALSCLLLPAPGASHDAASLLARAFKTGDEALVELSPDGHWILTRGSRKIRCSDGTSGCRLDRLAIYDLQTAAQVAELLSKPSANGSAGFGPAGFVKARFVSLVEYDGWDPRAGDVAQTVVEWDPLEGTQSRLPLPSGRQFSPLCPVESGRFLGLDAPNPRRRWDRQLLIGSTAGPGRGLPGYMEPSVAQSNCTARRSGGSLLLEQRRLGETLLWTSSSPNGPPRTCRTFPGERIHGYAISPNRSTIVVVTTPRTQQLSGSTLLDQRAFVHVLDAVNCAPLSRFDLSFPGDPRPNLYVGDFAKHVAISPDQTKIAVAYGVRYRSDGLAFFGIYALADGRRLATFKGDAYRGGYWESRRTLDIASASMAPLEGGVEFSADSRTLFATSKYLRPWDVSTLR